MTSEELKEAFKNGTPIMHRGIRYERINAIIYRYIKNKIVVSAELQSNVGHSITIARMKEITGIDVEDKKTVKAALS